MGGPPLSRTSSNDGSLRPENHKNKFTLDLWGHLEATKVTECLGLILSLGGHHWKAATRLFLARSSQWTFHSPCRPKSIGPLPSCLSTNNFRVAAYLIQTAECSSRNFLILWLATKILAKHGHEIQSQYCSGLGRVSGQDRVKCRWSVSLTLTIEHDVLNYWTKQWKKWLQIRVTGSLQAVRKHLLALIWQWRASVSMTRDRQAAFFSTLFDDRTPRTTFVGQRMETWGIN